MCEKISGTYDKIINFGIDYSYCIGSSPTEKYRNFGRIKIKRKIILKN